MKSNKVTKKEWAVVALLLGIVLAVALLLTPPPVTHAQILTAAENVSVVVSDKETHVDLDGTQQTRTDTVCSGFVVASTGTEEIIATASHCMWRKMGEGGLDLGIPETVTFFDGDHGIVQPQAMMDLIHDILVIRVHTMRRHPAAVLASSFIRGDDFFCFGQPEGYLWSYGRAFSMQGMTEVAPTTVEGSERSGLFEIGVTGVGHGSSGGAVFDAEGDVVGMVDALSTSNEDLGFMTGSSYVRAALANYQKAYH
jgi:S1-C subfamily serine protease